MNTKTKIVIIGGRGNGTVIASTIEDCQKAGQEIECAGFLNDNEATINDYPVLGGISQSVCEKLTDCFFIFAMSNIKQAAERYEMLKNLSIPIERFYTVVHPTAVVSNKAQLGKGVVIMPHVVVSPNAIIGHHSQMYAQSFIGHDSELKEMVFVANNASIGGRVIVHDGAHIGSNCSIRERLTIGRFAIVGLGATVLKNVENNTVVAGNPATTVKAK